MSLNHEFTLTIDIEKQISMVNNIPTFTQGDTAILFVKILKNGVTYDASGMDKYYVLFKRGDDQSVIGEGTYSNGLVKYNFGSTETSIPGQLEVAIQLVLGSERVTTQKFQIKILEDFENGIVSSTEYTVLRQLFLDVEVVKNNAQAQADYAKAQGDLAASKVADYNSKVAEFVEYPKDSVANFAALSTTFINPQNGWTSMTLDTKTVYRYSSSIGQWKAIRTYNYSTNMVKSATTPADTTVFWVDTTK